MGAQWPTNNLDTNYPPRVITPRKSVWACPGYNRVKGAFQRGGTGAHGSTLGSYGYKCCGGMRPLTGHPVPGSDYRLGLAGIFVGAEASKTWRGFPIRPTGENDVVNPTDMVAVSDAVLMDARDANGLGFLYVAGRDDVDNGVRNPALTFNLVLGLPPQTHAERATQQRHGGRWNTAFCDGHVENLRAAQLFDVRNDDVLKRWNNDNRPHRELAADFNP